MKNTALVLTQTESLDGGSVFDFYSLLKPRVMSLAVFTAACGLYLSPNALHPFLAFTSILSIALGAGAAGCLNMWLERDSDSLMSRTKDRPLPAKRIHADSALAFGMILSCLSVILLDLSAGHFPAVFLAFSIFYYVVIYTYFLKPRTAQNIVIGGAAGAFPPVIGWSCTSSILSLEPWILFGLIFMWTPAHFWALSLTLSKEYEKANIPIMPNIKGVYSTTRQIIVYTTLTVLTSFLPLFYSAAKVYGVVALVSGGGFMFYAYQLHKNPSSKKAIKLFLFSIAYLFVIFLAYVCDVWRISHGY